MIERRKTTTVKVGNVLVGSDHPVSIQSMTNTKTENVEATVEQIRALETAGCEIVRLAVPTFEAADAIKEIKKKIKTPLVADIHFDYRLAIAAMENGVDKIRLNPGNIGSDDRVKKVVEVAKHYGVPIRVGVNSGSLEKEILKKYGSVTAEGLVESALKHVRLLEKNNFEEMIVAIKSSNVQMTLKAFELLGKEVPYPYHIGITEAGTYFSGTVKSSIGIGHLLLNGIGDTMRVSLTSDPVNEVKVAKEILNALDLRTFGIKVISCPTCGRTNVNIEKMAEAVQERYSHVNADISVAVMGCVVNGPGEAREADLGIAGGLGEGLIFRKGQVIKKVKEEDLLTELFKEIDGLLGSING
jgi:(E)-4-hydroxy-3-methylbut-2-enyl-diphosphate synthase